MASPRWHPTHGGLAILAVVAACGSVPPPDPSPAVGVSPSPATAPKTATTPAPKAATAPAAKAAAPATRSAPSPAKSAPPQASTAPALDLRSLEQKLKDTHAIGLMTKLTIKNQVDDLVAQFHAYHEGRRPPTLAELRRPYELLLMKILSLLQDQDPGLAKALHESRESIWGVLSDRNKFAEHA
jgi:hypothetical protein